MIQWFKNTRREFRSLSVPIGPRLISIAVAEELRAPKPSLMTISQARSIFFGILRAPFELIADIDVQITTGSLEVPKTHSISWEKPQIANRSAAKPVKKWQNKPKKFQPSKTEESEFITRFHIAMYGKENPAGISVAK